MIQLNPPLPVITPKGKAFAHFIVDYGTKCDLMWVCFQNKTIEFCTWSNKNMLKADKNITIGKN